MKEVKIFLASSEELKADRDAFEIGINRRNNEWVGRGVHLKLVVWEDFLDAMSKTRLQDEYNQAIRGCDIFVMLFFTKVGIYTAEEFETAFKQFQATNKPFIFTYFKSALVDIDALDLEKNVASLRAFKEKLAALGHFHTTYKNVEGLLLHFRQQLDKLAADGFIEFRPDAGEAAPASVSYRAEVKGSGAVAQGSGAMAVGAGGVNVGGANTGLVNTGTHTTIDTGGGAYVGGGVQTGGGHFIGRDSIVHGVSAHDLEALFAPLLAAVAAQAPADGRTAALRRVEDLKAEAAKGGKADDGKVARVVDGLVGLVPGAVSTVVGAFASPLLAGVAGPVTKYVLDKFKPD